VKNDVPIFFRIYEHDEARAVKASKSSHPWSSSTDRQRRLHSCVAWFSNQM